MAILAGMVSATNATIRPLEKCTVSSSHSSDAVIHALTKDKDFQEYCYSAYKLCATLRATKASDLCIKYLKRKISTVEQGQLLERMGMKSETELAAFFKKMFDHRKGFLTKFPELRSMNNENELIKNASLITAFDLKFSKKIKYPASACWPIFAGASVGCTFACDNSEDPTLCWGLCISASIDAYADCVLLAD